MANKTWTVYWRTGSRQVVTGPTKHEALTLAGYSAGAVRTIDFIADGECHNWNWNNDTREWDPTPEHLAALLS